MVIFTVNERIIYVTSLKNVDQVLPKLTSFLCFVFHFVFAIMQSTYSSTYELMIHVHTCMLCAAEKVLHERHQL